MRLGRGLGPRPRRPPPPRLDVCLFCLTPAMPLVSGFVLRAPLHQYRSSRVLADRTLGLWFKRRGWAPFLTYRE